MAQQATFMQQVRQVSNMNANLKQGPTIIIRGRMPNAMGRQAFISQRLNFRGIRPGGNMIFTNNVQHPFNTNQNKTSQPTITEVDDNAPVTVNDSATSNTTSTVVIEEIS